MKHFTVILTALYMRDIVRVGEHLDVWLQNDEKVDEFLNDIHTAILKLETFPHIGSIRDDIDEGIRILTVRKKASVFFRVDDKRGEVCLLRVAYGGEDHNELFKDAQAITKLLSEDPT